MHEMALAQSILDIVRNTCAANGHVVPRKVGLDIGEMTHVDPDALRFGFAATIAGTAWEGAELEITTVPLRARCRACGDEFVVEQRVFICPHCRATTVEAVAGREMRVSYVEVD